MAESDTHRVYLMGGSKENGDLYVWEVYPEKPNLDKAVRGKSAELIAHAADAELMSLNYFEPAESMECDVYDNKSGKLIGRTPRRSPVYQNVAQDVADMLGKEKVTILIR